MHFPLHPETPDEGQTLEELFAGRDYDIDAAYRRMKGLMDAEGLDYGQRTHTYNLTITHIFDFVRMLP